MEGGVWKPLPGNTTQQDPLFNQLEAGAQQQLAQIGPLTDEAVAKVLSKMAKKAVGPDGLSAQMLRALQPDQVALVAQAFREWEASGHMPETVTMTLVTLLPKKKRRSGLSPKIMEFQTLTLKFQTLDASFRMSQNQSLASKYDCSKWLYTFVRFVSLAGDIFDRPMYVQGEKSDIAKSITPLQYRKLQS